MEEKLTQEEIRTAMRLFMCADRMHRTIAESTMQVYDLHRTQHMILIHLLRNEGQTVSQKNLAETFRISPAAVTNSLQKLEKKGWVSRTTSAADNRYHNIAITDAGKEILQQTRDQFIQVDAMAFAGITREELQAFSSCLQKITENLKPRMPQSLTEAENRKDEPN